MMKFYCLHEDKYEGLQMRLDQLQAACQQQGIEFVALDSLACNYTALPQLTKTDLLYNVGRGSQILESILLNESVTTFYLTNPALNQTYTTTDWGMLHDKAGIAQPKTIYHLPADRALLKQYVDYVGGFPIVLKATGSTRGIGTIKIDSWQNLISTVDYLHTTPDKFIMRQFIQARSGCRMIVLGNEVIAAADFAMHKDDFRNAVDLKQVKYFTRNYSNALKQTAVRATHLCNVQFGGVDFLEDEAGNYHLLEVNFPTGFSGLIEVCNIDIPFKMVEYLKNKAAT